MPDSTDPYRNTIKRTLEDQHYKERRKKFIQQRNKTASKEFFSQSIELPKNVNNLLGLGLFALIPYIIGALFIFFIIAQANMETYQKTDMNSFLLSWTIGYEVIAIILLLAIFKSGINFYRKQ